MAIAQGAGTEIIRCASFHDCSSATDSIIIMGEQYHIYTILNITLHASGSYTPFWVQGVIHGYDADNGVSGVNMTVFRQTIVQYETFVWDNKFSFNGAEPTDYGSSAFTSANQTAIAAQAQNTAQYFWIETGSASDSFEAHITFIDQNNS